MIARLGAVIFILLTFAFVVAAIIYGNSDAGADVEAVRGHERMLDLLRAAAFCSFICALFFGAMAELKRELEGIHTTLALQRPSTSQSPPDAPTASVTISQPRGQVSLVPAATISGAAHSSNGPQRAPVEPSAVIAAAPTGDGTVAVTPHMQRWFVAGRDAAGHPHTAYIDAEDRESAFAAAVARGLKEVTSLEPRQRPHD